MSKAQRRSSAHQVFLEFHKHRATSLRNMGTIDEEDKVPNEELTEPFEMFHHVNKTGVIYATARAQRYGFHNANSEVSIYFFYRAYNNMICLVVAISNDTILSILY